MRLASHLQVIRGKATNESAQASSWKKHTEVLMKLLMEPHH